MSSSTRNRPDNLSASDATEHTSRSERDYSEWINSRSRSRRSHRGITIRRGGPASGRRLRSTHAIDLQCRYSMIASGGAGC